MTSIFMKVLSMSITACYVIAALLIIRIFLRKAPKKFSYALWIAAAFRLCCPISFESLISLFNFGAKSVPQVTYTVAEHTGNAAVGAVASVTPPAVASTISAVTEAVTSAATEAAGVAEQASRAVEHIARVPQRVPTLTTGFSRIDETIRRGAVETVNKTVEASGMTTYEKVLLVFTVVWILGMVGFLVYGIVNDLKIRKHVQKAIKDEKNVYYCEEISSPFLFGIFKPHIYLPFGMEESEKEYILAHEKYHLKRKDHIIKLAAYFILTVHWFNPLVWVGFILMNKDLEMSCDEKIISGNQKIKKAYSTSLLSFATGKRTTSPVSLSFGESSVKERVENTLKWKKPKMWLSVTAVIICAVTLVACVSNPSKKIEKPIDENGVKTVGQFASTTVVKKKDGNTVAKYTKLVKTFSNGEQDVTEYEFDNKGNVIKEVETYFNGYQYVTEYAYDEKGNLVVEMWTNPEGEQEVTEYEYDDKGNVIKEVKTYSDGNQGVTEYAYDDKGNVIKEIATYSSGNQYVTEYEYDDKGNVIKESEINRNGGQFVTEYAYDDKGNVIKEIETFPDGNKYVTEYEYDDKGNVIKEIATDSDGNQYVTEYAYDEKGNLIVKMDTNQDVTEYEYEYDNKGNVIKEVATCSDGDQYVTEYEYDDKGNLIKETYIRSGEVEHTIEYFGYVYFEVEDDAS